VHQCDFLELKIGEKNSLPTLIPPETSVRTESVLTQQSSKLLSLPAASYDAITISLVLNYLPNPLLRENMIKKARELLIPPGEGGDYLYKCIYIYICIYVYIYMYVYECMYT
jgi:hypothetical protein